MKITRILRNIYMNTKMIWNKPGTNEEISRFKKVM